MLSRFVFLLDNNDQRTRSACRYHRSCNRLPPRANSQSDSSSQPSKCLLCCVPKVCVSYHLSKITTDSIRTFKPLVWRKLEHVVQTFVLGLAHQAHTLKSKHGLFSGFDFLRGRRFGGGRSVSLPACGGWDRSRLDAREI